MTERMQKMIVKGQSFFSGRRRDEETAVKKNEGCAVSDILRSKIEQQDRSNNGNNPEHRKQPSMHT